MNVELETRTPDTTSLFPFKVPGRILPDHLLGMGTPTVEIPTGTRIHEVSFKGRKISLILPDTNMVGCDEKNFIENKHATKLARQIFKYNNESIGIAQSYEDDHKDRKELLNMIKSTISDIPSGFLQSMQRSLLAYSYHVEKRITQSEENKPLGIIRNLTTNVLYIKESDNLIKERKSKDAAAVFDKYLTKLFKKYLRPIDESLKIRIGGIQMLKDGYEYYIATAIENFFKKTGFAKIGDISSLKSIVEMALRQKQFDDRTIRIQHTFISEDIKKIMEEPIIGLEESIKLFVANQIRFFPY